MDSQQLGDHLHRMVKLAMDTGEAATLADAERVFAGYQLGLEVGPDVAQSPTLQAAVLTVVNTGRRCFLGGVHVTSDLDVKLQLSWGSCRMLAEAILDLQGQPTSSVTHDIPRVIIGEVPGEDSGVFAVRATFLMAGRAGLSRLMIHSVCPNSKNVRPLECLRERWPLRKRFNMCAAATPRQVGVRSACRSGSQKPPLIGAPVRLAHPSNSSRRSYG